MAKASVSCCQPRVEEAKRLEWPEWWSWELELTPHLEKRMEDRDFNELDLRTMLENARACTQHIAQGRWIIETRHRAMAWIIIVEPDDVEQRLVVVTAYPVQKF